MITLFVFYSLILIIRHKKKLFFTLRKLLVKSKNVLFNYQLERMYYKKNKKRINPELLLDFFYPKIVHVQT